MDSLEETLQELEATLSEMGTNTTMTCPSSPQSPPSSPQVAALPLLSCCLTYCSSLWACRVERVVPQKLGPPPSFPPPIFVSAYLPLGALFPGQGLWAEPGAAGKPAHPGLSSAVWA